MCACGRRNTGQCIIENRSDKLLDTVLISISGNLLEFVRIAPGSLVEQPFTKALLDHKSYSVVGGFGSVGGGNFTTEFKSLENAINSKF